MPKRRAASRWLSPSTWQAWQTRPYSSTENIPALSGPWRASPKKAMTRYSFVPARPDYPVASVAYFSTAALRPEGFRCPRCAGSKYCEIRGRQLLQCRRCRHQTSLIAGTVLQGTKLPMRVWFRAMHLLAQGKKGLSNIELGRRLGISTNAAWRVQHKLMQAMIERDRRYKL